MNEELRQHIEYLHIAELKPYPRNPRTHSPAQVERIAASMREFGWTSPLLINREGEVIAGHGRLLAAQRLGMREVPAIRLEHLTPAQVRAYRLADNQLSLLGEWDEELLSGEVQGLADEDFDLGVLGFGEEELAGLLRGEDEGEGDLDEGVPEPPAEPVTRTGDLWLMGKHRLLCGDATSTADVARLLAGATPHLMVTDPPYGVEYAPEWRGRAVNPKNICGKGLVLNDNRADWKEAWEISPSKVAYVWHSIIFTRTAIESLEACNFIIRSQIIWAKSHFPLGRGDYHTKHEPCLYAVRKGSTGHWQGDRTQSTLWEINTPTKSETGHSAQKPIECMRRPIVNNSARGDGVYDPFVGSGTTLIAAEAEGRVCFAMEIAPQYCDVVVKRWEGVTGKQAVLERDGRTFGEVEGERVGAVEGDRE